MVENSLPLLLIATSFFGSERHAGRPCAIQQIKKIFSTKANILKRVTASRPSYSKLCSARDKGEATMSPRDMQYGGEGWRGYAERRCAMICQYSIYRGDDIAAMTPTWKNCSAE